MAATRPFPTSEIAITILIAKTPFEREGATLNQQNLGRTPEDCPIVVAYNQQINQNNNARKQIALKTDLYPCTVIIQAESPPPKNSPKYRTLPLNPPGLNGNNQKYSHDPSEQWKTWRTFFESNAARKIRAESATRDQGTVRTGT